MRLIVRHRMTHGLAADRRGLEAPGAPAGIEIEAPHRRHAHDRREVRRHVRHAGPLPVDLHVATGTETARACAPPATSAKSSVERVECSSYGSSEAPMTSSPRALWLTYTCSDAGDDDRIEPGLERLGDHRLQRMDVDRRAQPDHVEQPRRAAGDRAQHLAGRDAAAIGDDARDARSRPLILELDAETLRCSGGSRRRAGRRRGRSPRPRHRGARSRRARDRARRAPAHARRT